MMTSPPHRNQSDARKSPSNYSIGRSKLIGLYEPHFGGFYVLQNHSFRIRISDKLNIESLDFWHLLMHSFICISAVEKKSFWQLKMLIFQLQMQQ